MLYSPLFDFMAIWLRLFHLIMIFVVINVISSLKPLHLLLLLPVYIIIIMIRIIFKIHESSGVVDFILYHTVTSNERLKGIDVVLIIVSF